MLDSLIREPLALFIAQVVMILLVSRLLGLVARAVGQPMVVAEIVAGIVLGPSLLGWLFPATTGVLFGAESLDALHLVSELGLVLFMFLVGLELDPKLLLGRGRVALSIAQAALWVPFVLGALLAIGLHPRFAPAGVSVSSFALFFGAAMCTTAFPVLARILSERGLLRSRVGALTVACAAIDDVTAWCLLAFVVATTRAEGLGPAVRTTVLAAAYGFAMFKLARPLLDRLAGRLGPDGALSHTGASTFVLPLLLSACLTQWIGVHALFGAFLYGAIFPRRGGLSHALAEKLEGPLVAVLLPLFFAYSGIRTHIHLLDTPAAWATLALIIGVACLGKLGAGTLAARLSGLSLRESGALGLLLNTRGLMGLIALNLGLDLGVIDPAVFTMLVLMALFTTLLTTPALNAIYPPRQLALDLLGARAAPILARARDELRVLIGVADDQRGPGLLTLAAALAPERPIDALHLASRSGAEGSSLSQLVEEAERRGVSLQPLSYLSSAPAAEIVSLASIKEIDLVLLGWSPEGRVLSEVRAEASCAVAAFADRGLVGPPRKIWVTRDDDPLIATLADRFARAGLELIRAPISDAPPGTDLVLARFEDLACVQHAAGSLLLVSATRAAPLPH